MIPILTAAGACALLLAICIATPLRAARLTERAARELAEEADADRAAAALDMRRGLPTPIRSVPIGTPLPHRPIRLTGPELEHACEDVIIAATRACRAAATPANPET